MGRRLVAFAFMVFVSTLAGAVALAAPIATNGDPFILVATDSTGTQLFGLAADATGRIYIGNNSNNTTGIPVQRFDPALFLGAPVIPQSFGPNVGDADGLSIRGTTVYVADRDEGLRTIDIGTLATSILIAGGAINGTGSPVVVRPADGHIFIGGGGLGGPHTINEYSAAGVFIVSHPTFDEVETMTFDPATGLIYYAPFSQSVRSFNPSTNVDVLIGSSSGTIDGGLTFDPISGRLFVGTANGVNQGLVETIDPVSGVTSPFASGFLGSLGILRDAFTGDLYFLEQSALWRLESETVDEIVPPPAGSAGVPGPATLMMLGLGMAALTAVRRRART